MDLADSIKRLRELDAKRTQKSWHKMRGTNKTITGNRYAVVNGRAGGVLIAECPMQKKEGFYNAKFIAVAPEAIQTINQLVELVAEIYNNVEAYNIKTHDALTKADALLSKLGEV